jgi:hypothetical protein
MRRSSKQKKMATWKIRMATKNQSRSFKQQLQEQFRAARGSTKVTDAEDI